MKNKLQKTTAAVMAVIMMCAGVSCGAADGAYYSETSKSMKDNGVMYSAEAEMSDGFYEEPNTEEYDHYDENPYLSTAEHPLSTFSTDVDTASFTNVRRMLEYGQEIPPDAVRTEEFINYFKYGYDAPSPDSEDSVAINTELSDCPWNTSAKLLLIGLQAQEIETKDIDSNIVFLIDVSGSMYSDDKLPLVQQAFSMLAENLGENDRVSIVTYAGCDEVVLEGESGANYAKIADALGSLEAGGSTAGAAGINTAYEIAEKYFIEDGNNRVILATDGDLNVGVSSEEGLTKLIEQKRDKGVYLSVLGFGMGNYKDNKLEALADNGNGNYAYIDSIDEARRVLVTELNGTMFTVAKDAKVQVEFDPTKVSYYRLVGYENRLLDDRDFEDDTKDAGDMGAGQQVTVLYEIIPNNGEEDKTDSAAEDETASEDEAPSETAVVEEAAPETEAQTSAAQGQEQQEQQQTKKTLKYQPDVEYPSYDNDINEASFDGIEGELLTVSIRYKARGEEESRLLEAPVSADIYKAAESASDNMKLACAAAMFAKTLHDPENGFKTEQIRQYAEGLSLDSSELIAMLEKYESR